MEEDLVVRFHHSHLSKDSISVVRVEPHGGPHGERGVHRRHDSTVPVPPFVFVAQFLVRRACVPGDPPGGQEEQGV
eukprot:scaffold502_cov350-Pavlova_lutheri.AAC.21